MENPVSEPALAPVQVPEPKAKFSVMYLILSLLILVFLVSTAFLYYQNMQLKNMLASYQTQPTSSPIPVATVDPTANWKTYINTKHSYSVKYPTNWTFREFPDSQNGAGFRLLEKPNEIQYEVININFSNRALDSQNIPFEEYVKKAAIEDIQNYQSLATIDQVVTQTGLVGYKTTWNVIPIMGNTTKTYVSLPLTYFDTKNESGDTVQISLTDGAYLSIYNQVLSTFKFTK